MSKFTGKLTEKHLKKALQKYLMASYLYYIRYQSVMPDAEYDQLAKDLLEGYDDFEHQHKHLVSKEDLKAGTLFALKEDHYPTMVKAAADIWLRSVEADKEFAGQ